MRRAALACLLLALLLGTGGCSVDRNAVQPEMAFRYAENQAGDFPTTLCAYYFADRVLELSGGRIRIFVYSDAALGDERSMIEQMQYGGIDFGRVNLSPLSEYDNRLFTLQLPYLYESSEHMWRVLDSDIGDQYLQGMQEIGIVGLAWVDAGARNFYTSQAPVRTLADMQGLRIRVQENVLMERLVTLLGAVPEQMRYSEVLPALQTGKIDGAENNFPSYQSTGHYLVAPYMLEDEHSRIPEAIVASQAVMDKLSEADRAIIQTAAQEAAAYQRVLWREYEEKTRAIVVESGCEIYTMAPEEKEAFAAITAQMYQEFAEADMETIAAIQAMGRVDTPDVQKAP